MKTDLNNPEHLSVQFRRIPEEKNKKPITKDVHTLESLLMHPNVSISTKLKQDIIYKWSHPMEDCNATYIGECGRCLKVMIKEDSKSTQSNVKLQGLETNQTIADISQYHRHTW